MMRFVRLIPNRFPRNSTTWACFGAAMLTLAFVPEPFLPAEIVRFRDVLQRSGINRADYEKIERGYYEGLLDSSRSVSSSESRSEIKTGTPPPNGHGPTEERPILSVDDIREYVLQPSVNQNAFDTRWVTNRLGLRDSDYPIDKDRNTLRIAVLGDSIACGWGVLQEERFEELWESRLSEEARLQGRDVEVWNFATPGHSPGQRWKNFEIVGAGIEFDLVVYEGTTSDPGWDARRMAHFMARGVGLDDPLYAATLKAAGFVPSVDPIDNSRVLKKWSWTIVQNVYSRIASECHARKLPVAFVLIPRVGANLGRFEKISLLTRARNAGFDYVVDLTGAYGSKPPESLSLAPGDYHPNALGHSILAEAWSNAMSQWSELQERLESPGGSGQ